MTIVNALTVDVEDYFHVHAFSEVIRPQDWDSLEPRVEHNTNRILDLLDFCARAGTADYGPDKRGKATFFVLGWVAERYPALVKKIQARGHEVACHGYAHERICSQTKDRFKEELRKAKEILEDITCTAVVGYRAPTYSVTPKTLWSLEIIHELGFRYDSSIFPIKHDYYGFPEAPRFPFVIDFSDGDISSQIKNPKYLHQINGCHARSQSAPITDPSTTVGNLDPGPYSIHLRPNEFVEFPMSTVRVLGRNLPCSGGGYFRLFPYSFTRWGFRKLNNNGTQPGVFYIHPWELDSDLPRIDSGSGLARFRTYVNLHKTETKLKRLLSEFTFAPLAEILASYPLPHPQGESASEEKKVVVGRPLIGE